MSDVVGVIPARFGSSRFPGKPLAKIAGKPMIYHVWQRAKQVIAHVYVATDDTRISNVCDAMGIPVILTSSKHETGTDRIAEVARTLAAKVYINIQGDEPLCPISSIQAVYDAAKRFSIVNAMCPVLEADVTSQDVPKVVVDKDSNALFLSRSPIPFLRNVEVFPFMKQVGIYGFSREALARFASTPMGPLERAESIEILRFIELGEKVKMVAVRESSIAVDRPEDIERVEQAMQERA